MRNAETILGIIRVRNRSLESRLEIERLTSGLEGGCWKSAHSSNSLAAYPTVTHGFEAEPERRRSGLGSNLWLIQPTAFVAHLRLIHSIRGRGLGRNESGA
jgi:hypothetical protein